MLVVLRWGAVGLRIRALHVAHALHDWTTRAPIRAPDIL